MRAQHGLGMDLKHASLMEGAMEGEGRVPHHVWHLSPLHAMHAKLLAASSGVYQSPPPAYSHMRRRAWICSNAGGSHPDTLGALGKSESGRAASST